MTIEPNIIKTKKYTLSFYRDNTIIECLWDDNAEIDVADLNTIIEAVNLYPEMHFTLLLEGKGSFSMTKEARELIAEEKFANIFRRIAVYTDFSGVRLLMDLFIRTNKPFVMLKVFNDRKLAREWLLRGNTN